MNRKSVAALGAAALVALGFLLPRPPWPGAGGDDKHRDFKSRPAASQDGLRPGSADGSRTIRTAGGLRLSSAARATRIALPVLVVIMILSSGCSAFRTDRILHAVFSAHACCLAGGTAEHLGAGDDCIRISSAATALGLGLAKELWDSRGHGVFDFADLAADIAGTAAGYAAVEHFIAED